MITVPGQTRRLDLDGGRQLAHRHGPVLKQLQHTDPDGVAEESEQLRLGFVQGHGHHAVAPSSGSIRTPLSLT
jgi:hypothetical protein